MIFIIFIYVFIYIKKYKEIGISAIVQFLQLQTGQVDRTRHVNFIIRKEQVKNNANDDTT